MPEKKQLVNIGAYKVKISNLDKVLYPNAKIVKAEIIEYYIKIAKWMLIFAKNRPISMLRFPDGIFAHQFYSKNAPDWKPDWMLTHQLQEDDNNYILIQGAQDLVWLANIASLENHAMNKRLSGELYMDHMIFDFDPPEQFNYLQLRDLTISIGGFLREKGYHPFVKTSGSRGCHIYIPIVKTLDYQLVIREIKILAKAIAKRFPEELTNAFRKESRKGKILVDINRNYKAQTTILPFSTRARPSAPISMPLSWEDFSLTKSSQDFNIKNVFGHLEEKGYAWEDFDLKGVNVLSNQIEYKKVNSAEKESSFLIPDWFEKPSYKHMLAVQTTSIARSKKHVYENKWDGIRVFIYLWNGVFKIHSRSGRDITHVFPELILDKVDPKLSVVLDGEIVVVDEKGRPIFARVISRLHSKRGIQEQIKTNRALFYAFDIVLENHVDLCQFTWKRRREILSKSLLSLTSYRLSSATLEGELLYKAAEKMDLEGIMIKNVEGKYLEGNRSENWKKLKFRLEAQCIILGYTEGDGDRSPYFGSIHVAENIEGELRYRGRVGTGFNMVNLRAYKMLFDQLKKGKQFIDGQIEEKNKSVWFAKKMPICEIQFARLTESGTFREPVFKKMEEHMYDV